MEPDETYSNIEKKLDTLLKVLQDFGLNFIQSLGELKHSIGTLVDKTNSLDKSLIDLKGLAIKLQEISKNEHKIQSELKSIKSFMRSSLTPVMQEPVDMTGNLRVENEISTKSIEEMLEKMESISNIEDLIKNLEKLKENIYINTGGHRVLFKMNQSIQDLKTYGLKGRHISDVKKDISEKLFFWKNQL